MFFLARSAVCIGVVAAMLPDASPLTGRAIPSGAVQATANTATSWLQSQQPRQAGRPDQAGRFALTKLAGTLVDRGGLSMEHASMARDAAVRFGLRAVFEHATNN